MRVKGTPNVSNFHYKVTYKDEVKYFKTQPDIIRCYNISRHAIHHGVNPNLTQFKRYKDYKIERIHKPVYEKIEIKY